MTHRHIEAFVLLDGERKSRESRLHRARNGSVRLDNQRGRTAQPFDKAGERGGRVDDGYAHVRTEHRLLFDGGSGGARRSAASPGGDGIRATRLLNSSSRKTSSTLLRENPQNEEASKSNPVGAAVSMVTRCLLLSSCSACSRTSPCMRGGVTSSTRSTSASALPNSVMSFTAVLLADAGNAGDVVGRIACERLHVTLLVRLESAVALAHCVHVVDLRSGRTRW